MLEDRIDELRRRTPPWDHLRERRVLREVERKLGERRAGRPQGAKAFLLFIPVSVTLAGLFLAYFAGLDLAKKRAVATQGAVVPAAVSSNGPSPGATDLPSEPTEVRVLRDGTRLELSSRARVEVRSESKTRVELVQDEGRVRYQVPPVSGRAFVVFARGVQVQVKGTIFVVEVGSGKVSVQVERGLVRVAASSGQVDLGVGDELSTPVDQDTGPGATSPDPAPSPRLARTAGSTAASVDRSASANVVDRSASANVVDRSASVLLERADAERQSGDLSAAAATLRELLARHPNDRRAALTWFTLGKVERARDRPAVAAKVFHTSYGVDPQGPMSEDALAEEALAWEAANDNEAARATAEQCAKRFPNGTHAARLQHLLE